MVEIKSIKCNSIKCNSTESIEHNSVDTSNLNNHQFRMNKISESEDYYYISNKWWCLYCILCNNYWSTYRNNKGKS